MNDGLQVIMISAFYRADESDGISVGAKFTIGTSGVEYCLSMQKKLAHIDALTVDDVLADLRRLSPARHRLTHAETFLVIALVCWLQERGHLVADEYNGPVFHCVFNGALINCERNPVTVDLAKEMTGKNAVDVTDIVKASKALPLDAGATEAIRVTLDHARRQR